MTNSELVAAVRANDPTVKSAKLRIWSAASFLSIREALAHNTRLEKLQLTSYLSSLENLAPAIEAHPTLKKFKLISRSHQWTREDAGHHLNKELLLSLQNNSQIETITLHMELTNPSERYQQTSFHHDILQALHAANRLNFSLAIKMTAVDIPFLQTMLAQAPYLKELALEITLPENAEQHTREIITALQQHAGLEKLSLTLTTPPSENLSALIAPLKQQMTLKKFQLAYPINKTELTAEQSHTLKITEANQTLYATPARPWPSFKQVIQNTLLLLPRLLFLPISLPFSLIFTRYVTSSSNSPELPNWLFEPILKRYLEWSANPRADLSFFDNFLFKIARLRSDHPLLLPTREISTTETNDFILRSPIQVSLEGKNASKPPISISTLTLKNSTHKLHINIPPAGGCEGFTPVSACVQKKALQFKADQWCMSRHGSWTVKGQKQQLRQLIAAAIQQGKKEITLDGFSYGAGLVRKVYHEIMADKQMRQYLKDNGVVLHYIARNGFINEFIAAFQFIPNAWRSLTNQHDAPPALSPLDPHRHILKPGRLLSFCSKIFHQLCLFDFSLQAEKIDPNHLDPKSRNYHVNTVLAQTTQHNATPQVAKDNAVRYHERSHGKKYGHSCVDIFATQYEEDTHNLALDKKPYLDANQHILNDLQLDTLPEKEVFNILSRLQQEIIEKPWNTARGGVKVRLAQPGAQTRHITVPKHANKQLILIQQAKNREISPVQALIRIRDTMQKASDTPSTHRDLSKTQPYYNSFRDHSCYTRFGG